MVYCSECGNEVRNGEKFCDNCGSINRGFARSQNEPRPQVVVHVQKNPGVAAVLGIILGLVGIFGIGQIYAGKFLRGILLLLLGWVLIGIFMVLGFAVGFTAAMATENIIILLLTLGITIGIPIFFYIWQAYDAFKLCKEFNKVVTETGRAPW